MGNGSHVELEFLPFAPGFSYRINGVLQVPTANTGNPIDPLSSGLCSAVVAEGKTSITVRDSGPARVTSGPAAYIIGGAWSTHASGRSNLMIEAITQVSGGGSS